MSEMKIEELFESIKPIITDNKKLQAEKESKGEFFNIFSILKMETDEVNTHSAFLAELLNPKGSHGQQDLFLRKFLETIVHTDKLNIQNAQVCMEFTIGPISENYETGGRIDILIHLPKAKYLILIENKINAGDQKLQLFRYNQYAHV